MPELPEVETVRRGLSPVMEGRRIDRVEVRRPDLRFPFPDRFAERLTGRRIDALGRRAKYLIADLDDGAVLVMHLGMSGSFRIDWPEGVETPGVFHRARSRDGAHDHVLFHMEGGATVTYNDPRRFGFMTMTARAELAGHPLFAHLGVEPTGNALSADGLAERFRDKRTSLKAALLDQGIVAGLGNIYVCEALWRARLDPRREAASVVTAAGRPRKGLQALAPAIREVIAEAIAAGGSSLRDHMQADGSLGYFQHRFAVYDREGEPCARPECAGVVERVVQTGRSTFFCPACQH